ncbi:sulfatase [Thermophagus sp. OGC60D27]|uniref:sulfatase n=1 Tax=Thermophagus sp. OGC60D27 TaxID=3458415 RepID=UPI0040376987
MRTGFNTIYCFLLIPLLFCGCVESKPEKERMNVLYIYSDDLNDWNSVLEGHPQAITPNIDRLAKKSVVFTNAHCPSPLCNASRASTLTGYYPFKTGVYTNAQNFRKNGETEDAVTLPQYFSANGYHSIAAGKVFHHPRGAGEKPAELSDSQSWDEEWVGHVGTRSPKPFPEPKIKLPGDDFFGKHFVWGACPEELEETHDYQLTRYISDFLGKNHEKPFFAACGIFRPHLPWFVPQEFIDMYPLDEVQLPKVFQDDLDDIPEIAKGFIKPHVQDALVRQGKWKEAVRAYLASISYADYCIGMLLDALEKSDYADNTIVVLSGDHGWHLGEKKHWTKFTLWERATKTSLMIHVPEMSVGECKAPVNLIDLYPTLNDLCNLPVKGDLHGHTLRPLLENPNSAWPYTANTWFGDPGNFAIRDADWRYIHYKDGSEELYNHQEDPNEWYNLAKFPKYDDLKKKLIEKSGVLEFVEF